jgi:hypothetical protein
MEGKGGGMEGEILEKMDGVEEMMGMEGIEGMV